MEKMRIRKVCKESRGFTMLEMIITVTITAIFFTSVVTILPSILKSYNKIISLNYARQVSSSVAETISEQLTYATGVVIVKGENKNKDTISYGYKGQKRIIELGLDGVIPGLVYDKDYYMDKHVEISLEEPLDGSTSYKFIIKICKEEGSEPILTKVRVVRLYGN